MMSFDFYPDAVTVQTDVVTQGGGTSGVAPVGSGDMYPDTDAFWGGGFSVFQGSNSNDTRVSMSGISNAEEHSYGLQKLLHPDMSVLQFTDKSSLQSSMDSHEACERLSSYYPEGYPQSCRVRNSDRTTVEEQQYGLKQDSGPAQSTCSTCEFDYPDSFFSAASNQRESPGVDVLKPEEYTANDRFSGQRFASPGAGRELARLVGWQQKWRTIGFYLDEFRGAVPINQINLDLADTVVTIPNGGNITVAQQLQRIQKIYSQLPQSFLHYLTYKVGARYGRSVGRLQTPRGGFCSSWLVGGPTLLTAAHCGPHWPCLNSPKAPRTLFPDTARVTRNVVFGEYDPENRIMRTGQAGGVGGNDYLEGRLRSLGFPEVVYTSSGLQIPRFWQLRTSLKTFGSRVDSTSNSRPFQCRDVLLMRASGRSVNYRLNVMDKRSGFPRLVEEELQFLPSFAWGTIPLMNEADRKNCPSFGPTLGVEPRCPGPGGFRNVKIVPTRKIYILQSQEAEVYGNKKQTLLSFDGEVAKEFLEGNQQKTFVGKDLYWEKGSSGGAILDLLTNRATGVLSEWAPFMGNVFHPNAGVRTTLVSKNTDDTIARDAKEVYDPERYPHFSLCLSNLFANAMRSSVSEPTEFDTLLCPRGMVAAGVLGSRGRSDRDRMGNFGFVCIPFGGGSSFGARQYLFDQARVIATGSRDTGRGLFRRVGSQPTDGEKFDTYINEVVVRQDLNQRLRDLGFARNVFAQGVTIERTTQSFSNCPPNYYLNGMLVEFDSFQRPMLKRVPLLFCENADQSRLHIREVPQGPDLLGGVSSDGEQLKLIRCPPGCFIKGLAFQRDRVSATVILPLCAKAQRSR